jgi:hypothetical protein
MTIHLHVLGCVFCDEEALGSACSVVFFGFPRQDGSNVRFYFTWDYEGPIRLYFHAFPG